MKLYWYWPLLLPDQLVLICVWQVLLTGHHSVTAGGGACTWEIFKITFSTTGLSVPTICRITSCQVLTQSLKSFHIIDQYRSISSHRSVRWRLCCWQQNGRREGCHSATPLGWLGLSAAAQTGAPPSSGWCCCDTSRSPPSWSETDENVFLIKPCSFVLGYLSWDVIHTSL